MESSDGLSTKQRLFVVLSIVLGCVLLTASAVSSSRKPAHHQQEVSLSQQEVSLPIVKSQTESLRFINTEKVDFRFITRMQNVSKKSITAYAVSLCNAPLFATDYSIGNDSIGPGKIVEISTPIQTVAHTCGNLSQPIITILAVVFDDRSTGGEFTWAKGILDSRRGEKIQLKRINRLLTEAANWADADKPAGIERLKSEITALPVDEGELPSVRGGLASARDRTLYMIAELEQWNSGGPGIQSESNQHTTLRAELAGVRNLREGFAKLISLNEQWISKY